MSLVKEQFKTEAAKNELEKAETDHRLAQRERDQLKAQLERAIVDHQSGETALLRSKHKLATEDAEDCALRLKAKGAAVEDAKRYDAAMVIADKRQDVALRVARLGDEFSEMTAALLHMRDCMRRLLSGYRTACEIAPDVSNVAERDHDLHIKIERLIQLGVTLPLFQPNVIPQGRTFDEQLDAVEAAIAALAHHPSTDEAKAA